MALHRSGKAYAERLRRVVQRRLSGRAFERNLVLIADRGPREDRRMEEGLQPQQTPLIPRQSHAARICNQIETGSQSRMRLENNRRILPKTGGKSGLRSSPKIFSSRNLATLLAPAVFGPLADAHPADRTHLYLPLPDKHHNLPLLRDNLFRLLSHCSQSDPPLC